MSEEQLNGLTNNAQAVAKCLADCTVNNIQNPSAIQGCAAGCQPGNGAQGIQVYVYLLLCLT